MTKEFSKCAFNSLHTLWWVRLSVSNFMYQRRIIWPFWDQMVFASLVPISRPKKSLDFPGPPLPMPLVMNLVRLKTITYRATYTTGTLIIILHPESFEEETFRDQTFFLLVWWLFAAVAYSEVDCTITLVEQRKSTHQTWTKKLWKNHRNVVFVETTGRRLPPPFLYV